MQALNKKSKRKEKTFNQLAMQPIVLDSNHEVLSSSPQIDFPGYKRNLRKRDWHLIGNQMSIWNPAPEITHQAISSFLDLWVEQATTTSALFIIPRILQRDWGFLSKHVVELGVFDPRDLPWGCRFPSLIPFCLLHVPRCLRTLPSVDRMDVRSYPTKFERWCNHQATELRGL
jgi:hypothetical protein